MELLNKPKFFNINSTMNIIGVIEFILGIIQFFIPENILSIKNKVFIFITSLIIFLLICIFKYIGNWNKIYKEYKNLHKRHLALSEQFDEKRNKINELGNLLIQYDFIFNKNIANIQNEVTNNITKTEKNYLKELYAILLKDKEHLYNLGGNKNGK